jgi:PemK-like, MazF-like toxin of type II toxin-antitoxin system
VAYRFGDVLLVPISFSDARAEKKRPVLVIRDAGDADLLVVPIPSHPPRSFEDITLPNWRCAGLRLPSTARMAKLATVAKSTVIRQLGSLRDRDAQSAREILRQLFEKLF